MKLKEIFNKKQLSFDENYDGPMLKVDDLEVNYGLIKAIKGIYIRSLTSSNPHSITSVQKRC